MEDNNKIEAQEVNESEVETTTNEIDYEARIKELEEQLASLASINNDLVNKINELQNKELYNGLDEEIIKDVENSGFNYDGKSYLVEMIKKYNSSNSQVDNQATIVNEEVDSDEIIEKPLDELL